MLSFNTINITSTSENEGLELKHVDQMKDQYGEQNWMWYVMDTENDCRIAEMHRNWLYNKGVPPDFDIREEEYQDLTEDEIAREIEYSDAYENSDEKKKEDERVYIFKMFKKYGEDWEWAVIDTDEDSHLAKKYRQNYLDEYADEYTGKTNKLTTLYPREFYDNDEEYEKAKCGYESELDSEH
jgi:hypothetical protein